MGKLVPSEAKAGDKRCDAKVEATTSNCWL